MNQTGIDWKGGWQYPAFWSLALVVQALLGSGAYSLGHILGIGWH
jgi:putative oxidoreductase